MCSFKKDYHIALKYLSYMPRTEQEIINHLMKKDATHENILEIVHKLKGLNYINDIDYTRRYISYNQSQKSRLQIKKELENKGIPGEIYENIMVQLYTDSMELQVAESIIRKICKISEPLSFYQLKSKINYKLKYKMFSNDTIKKCMDQLIDNEAVNKKLDDSIDKLKEKAKKDGLKYFNKYAKKHDHEYIIRTNTLNSMLRKGYPNKLCLEIVKELME